MTPWFGQIKVIDEVITVVLERLYWRDCIREREELSECEEWKPSKLLRLLRHNKCSPGVAETVFEAFDPSEYISSMHKLVHKLCSMHFCSISHLSEPIKLLRTGELNEIKKSLTQIGNYLIAFGSYVRTFASVREFKSNSNRTQIGLESDSELLIENFEFNTFDSETSDSDAGGFQHVQDWVLARQTRSNLTNGRMLAIILEI